MALQTPNLTMVGLGIAQDRPPNNIQPPLVDGVHLRWAFPSERGFPWYGFYLYRRPHRAGTPILLSSALGNLHPGPLPFNFLNTPYGQLSSDQNLVLTDDFPPTGQVELDLDHRAYTRITFPSDQLMRSIQSTIGLRARAGDPPATRTVIDFSNRAPGSGPNPDTEQGVSFNAFDANGKSLPVSHILSVPGMGTQVTGFDCQWNVNVTLPTPATFVQLTLTPLVKSVRVEAFNADGSSAGSATTMIPYGRTPETLTITGQAITRIVIQPHSDFTNNADGTDLTAIGKGNRDDSGSHSLLNQFCFGTGRLVAIEATAYSGTTPVAQTQIRGQAGQVISSSLEFEGISEVEFSSDTAALIDLGVVPLMQEATVGWTQMPDFTYPLRLPVTQPDYPCTPGAAENLEAARSLARQRVVYGAPGQFTAPPTQITNAGTITLVQGSSIVIGSGTAWGAPIANAMLQVKGDLTAYAVIQVISPTKLVLSRAYRGASAKNVAYALNNDNFAQYHDHLIQLVSGGSAAGSMGSRVLPAPIKTSGSVSVTQNATNVVGSGTQWDASLVGLSIEMAGDQVPYTIVSISSPTQLTLDRVYAGGTLGGQAYQINARISGQQDSAVSGTPPALAPQRIIDTVLLSTLQPAIAQMTGIYWVDQKATSATAFDYLLVADYSGVGGLNSANVLARLQQDNFATLEGCIVFNKQIAPAVPLQSPGDLRLYALPGNSRLTANGTNQDASNNVGLRWDLSVTDQGNLLPGRAIMYHLWRASLGNGTAPTVPGSYTPITQNQPVLVSGNLNSAVQISPAWPPFRMYYVDPALADGWYSYEVSGIDIFGRHSPNSGPGPWYEWIPVPDPRPRYYKDPPGNSIVNPSAVQLLSERVPPAPTGIEAYALDPQDPTLLRDSAYNAWFATLSSAEKQSLVGLRVRWSWTQAQMQQAPDTSEFRIYYHSGRMNVLPTTISNISFVPGSDGAESFVQTDITTVPAVDAYAGAWLRSGSDSFAILGNDASSPLHLRVRNIGSSSATGTVTVTAGSTTVAGQGTNWTIGLTGRTLQLAGDATHYLVANIVSSTQLTLQQPYSGTGSANRAYTIFDSVPQNDASAGLTLPPVYAVGNVTLVNGSSTVTGNETNWNPTLVGMPFQVGGDSEIYTIVSIDSTTQLRLSRSYTAP
ncbi:MAG TPA: hypothetical protein VFN23_21210, partial [Ktedonobacteraceae bacterium]|nr:hypothetical protein [Ktedonobacteraceae bacterium]